MEQTSLRESQLCAPLRHYPPAQAHEIRDLLDGREPSTGDRGSFAKFNSQRMATKDLIWGYRAQLPVSATLPFTGICVHKWLECVGQKKKHEGWLCGGSDLEI